MTLSVRKALAGANFVSLEQARQAVALARPTGARDVLSALVPPRYLQFRLKYFMEHESTDAAFQGAADETYISAIGMDSSLVTVGPGHQPEANVVTGRPVGAPARQVRETWQTAPHVLVEFDLRRPGDWPRTYTTTLLLVEHDSGNLAEAFEKLETEVGLAIQTAAVAAASLGAGALAGAALGSIVPGIGTAVGAAVGALAATAYDGIVATISQGLADDIFRPVPITLTVDEGWLVRQQPELEIDQVLTIREHGAVYDIKYNWHLAE